MQWSRQFSEYVRGRSAAQGFHGFQGQGYEDGGDGHGQLLLANGGEYLIYGVFEGGSVIDFLIVVLLSLKELWEFIFLLAFSGLWVKVRGVL